MSKVLTVVSLMVILAPSAFAQNLCRHAHQEITERTGYAAQFLLQRDQRLHTNPNVERVANRAEALQGTRLQRPASRVQAYIDYLTQFASRAQRSEVTLDLLKQSMHKAHVIKPEDVPQSYFDFQVRLARERGHGDIVLTSQQKRTMIDQVIKDQQSSLDSWTQYLVSPHTDMYPMWIKYWMFTGMTKLSKYNIENGTFGNRDKGTVAPFAELNREALSMTVNAVLKHLNKTTLEQLNTPEAQAAIESMNFGRIYGRMLLRLGFGTTGRFATNEGRWVVYKQGTDHMPLLRSLEGKNTGWCTAGGEATAKAHLDGGDFHVYYSLDKDGQPTIPRIAVRMEDSYIAEVRGVEKNQEIDAQISQSNIMANKMKEFGSQGTEYIQKDANMKLLTRIDRKNQRNEELTSEELRFLYEVDRQIIGFGYQRDPRIDAIKAVRNQKKDLVTAFDGLYKENEIGISAKDVTDVNNTIKFFYGDLILKNRTLNNLKLPKVIIGNLAIDALDRAENLILPEIVQSISMKKLTYAKGITFPSPQRNGYIHLPSLREATDIIFLDSPNESGRKIRKHISLRSLKSARGVKFAETFVGDILLNSLETSEGLHLPPEISILKTDDFYSVLRPPGAWLPDHIQLELTRKPE